MSVMLSGDTAGSIYLRMERNATEVELSSTASLTCITNAGNATIEWVIVPANVNILSTSRVEGKEVGGDDIVKSVVQFSTPNLTSPTTLTLGCSTKTAPVMTASSTIYFYSELNAIRCFLTCTQNLTNTHIYSLTNTHRQLA